MSSENIINDIKSQERQLFAVKFSNPEIIVEKLELQSGNVVADFGCGAGYFSLPIAKKIGEQGVVYALDILPQSLESVSSKAKSAGLNNIVTKRVNLEKEDGSGLPDGSCDWVVMKCILFQNKDKSGILAEANRVLKLGGKVLIVEWNMKDSSIGPDMSLRISKESLTEIIQKIGFSVFKELPVNDFHYGLVFVK
jgi:ubiquinone/menaquinone biosynthesis C-methylase UbiE